MPKRKLSARAKSLMADFSKGHSGKRFNIAAELRDFPHPKVTSFLLQGLGDRSLSVRSECARALMKRGKTLEAVEAFSKIAISTLPKLSDPHPHYLGQKIARARAKRMAEMRKAQAKGKMDKWRAKYVHRGFEIYLIEGFDRLAQNNQGRILICKSTSRVPARFRHILAEHEYFEYVSHPLALAAELIYAKKHGLLADYLKWMRKNKINAFRERTEFANTYLGWNKKP